MEQSNDRQGQYVGDRAAVGYACWLIPVESLPRFAKRNRGYSGSMPP